MSYCSVVKNLPANTGDVSSVTGSGRYPGEGNGDPLRYACLGNPMDRGARQTAVHRAAKESDMTQQLSNNSSCNKTLCKYRLKTIEIHHPTALEVKMPTEVSCCIHSLETLVTDYQFYPSSKSPTAA